jgi:hypothetical protein
MLMKLCPHYMDTFKFYMDRITTYSNFVEACVYGTKEMLELLINKNISIHTLELGALSAAQKERHDIVQFLNGKGIDINNTNVASEYYFYVRGWGLQIYNPLVIQ